MSSVGVGWLSVFSLEDICVVSCIGGVGLDLVWEYQKKTVSPAKTKVTKKAQMYFISLSFQYL